MADSLTLALSIWGAVIATILLIKEIAEYRRDRANVWIRAVFGSMERGENTIGRGVSVRIVNRGRRVLHIREVKVILREKHDEIKLQGYTSLDNDRFWLFPEHKLEGNRDSTISLQEGEQVHLSDWVSLKTFRDFAGARTEVVTTTGKCYKARMIDLFDKHSLGADTWV